MSMGHWIGLKLNLVLGEDKMIEATKKVPKYKKVRNGTKDVKVWVATDGKEFRLKSECAHYELALERSAKKAIFNGMKRAHINYVHNAWYYISNEDELNAANLFVCGERYDLDEKSHGNVLKIGDWFHYEYHGGDGYVASYSEIYTLDYVLAELEKIKLGVNILS